MREADCLRSITKAFELLRGHVTFSVHLLGNGNEPSIGAPQGFTAHINFGKLDVE